MKNRNTEIQRRIIRAATEIGGEYGVDSVTMRKVSRTCGISLYTCFDTFGTVRNLLDAAAGTFETEYIAAAAELLDLHHDAESMFLSMLDRLVADPAGTLFYLSYAYAYGTVPSPDISGHCMLKESFATAVGKGRRVGDEECAILWNHVTASCLRYARSLALGHMADGEAARAFVMNLVFDGARQRKVS